MPTRRFNPLLIGLLAAATLVAARGTARATLVEVDGYPILGGSWGQSFWVNPVTAFDSMRVTFETVTGAAGTPSSTPADFAGFEVNTLLADGGVYRHLTNFTGTWGGEVRTYDVAPNETRIIGATISGGLTTISGMGQRPKFELWFADADQAAYPFDVLFEALSGGTVVGSAELVYDQTGSGVGNDWHFRVNEISVNPPPPPPPVPEPCTVLALGVGVLALGRRRRRPKSG